MDIHRSESALGALPSASLSTLRSRARVLRTIRRFFEMRDYVEVETPLLSRDVCVDAWVHPIAVDSGGPGQQFLQTSPEFHMKRMVAGGAERIYQMTRSFRAGEQGPLHNPEFTILEWYAVGETYLQQMDLVEELVRNVAALEVNSEVGNGQSSPELPDSFERLRYNDAFTSRLGTGVLSLTAAALRDLANQHGLPVPQSLREDDRDGLLNVLLSSLVEPQLATAKAVFLFDYPSSQAALARVRDGSPPVAERFELYLNGIEICNGYQELTDADELARRMAWQSDIREADGRNRLPIHSLLWDSMRNPGLPECAGVALGIDRLVMWRLGAERLEDVVAFPADRA